jgi:DNA-binding CsgD family transcriptional regulator
MERSGELLLDIYRGAREISLDDFQAYALRQLKSVIPFDMARWGTSARDERGVDFHRPCVLDDPPDTLESYAEIREQDLPARYVIDRPGLTGNFALTAQFGASPKTAGIFAYARRFRHEHGLITAFRNPQSGLLKTVSLYGAYFDRPFTEHQRRTMQTVAPHLMEAWAINQILHLEQIRAAASETRWSMAIADAAGHLIFAESDFESMLCAEWPASQHMALPAPMYDAIFNSNRKRYAGRTFVATAMPSRSLCFLKARRRLPVDSLTARECEIAQHIAQGLTHKDIARRLNIAPATVRNHVQSILVRACVHNNAELVAQLKRAGY